ncbi:MAG: CTP synthase [Candidatus Odinarchaeum yellowstonii]|uniref:CTP synthase (glutamine hydrolyzing) n=1 Tax=Odinarchaeota yellowstonii (strain LCB_4) TaxID=1841599 RepID=A0AAF0D3G9_ODILC|nr:MAG: CTP synthase [Candidatus Odinarchaeum yellowstonii]
MVKYVFVTGGVMSGIGKGITAASIGKLFQFRGYSVDIIKIDPYLNVDPGVLNPIEHGEVFVTEEVWDFTPVPNVIFRISEIDQDFGTYERFLDKNIHPRNNITSGQIFLSVLLKERRGEFLGRTVQIVPHITDEIKKRIRLVAEKSNADIIIVELGGTIGDIEGMPFVEAIRQLSLEEGRKNSAIVHVAYVPFLSKVGQLKTKPAQHSVKTLQSLGLQPDIVVGRADIPLTDDVRAKIAMYCNVPEYAVISSSYIDIVYEMPLNFESQGLGDTLCRILELPIKAPDTSQWVDMTKLFKSANKTVNIAMPGKYCAIIDSYISINEALKHAGAHLGAKVNIKWIDTLQFEQNPQTLSMLKQFDGILLTPGFGFRGVEGMILTAQFAYEQRIPFLGICFGAQLMFVAFCRKALNLPKANSTEVDPNTPDPVVDLLPEQKQLVEKGGTMKLGGHRIFIKKGTRLYEAYKRDVVVERFRHRFHIINEYAEKAESKGLTVSSYDESGSIINSIEINNGNWMVGVQFHPEFKSRPNSPSPVYYEFIKQALKRREFEPPQISFG